MNWLPTIFLGAAVMLGVCAIVGIAEDGIRGWLSAQRVVREAEEFQRGVGR